MNGPKMGWDTGWKPGVQSIPAIAPGYKKQVYPEGAVVSIGDKLYTSNTEITTPEDFDKSHWDETDVSEYLNELNSKIEGIGNPIVLIDEATVSELNGTIEGLKPGWAYTLTDAGTLTAGSVKVEPGDEVAWTANEVWIKIGGESGVKYVDTSTSYSDVSAAISRGQLPVMQVFSSGSTLYYFPFYNGYGRIEFRSIQDNSILCLKWNGTAWAAGDSVIYGMGSDTKSEVDIVNAHLDIDGSNVVTKVTLATMAAVTFSVNESVPAFAIEIDNTGNSNDVTVEVMNGSTALKYSSAAGNRVGAGKYVQLTCVGGCWTLAEFEAPVTP